MSGSAVSSKVIPRSIKSLNKKIDRHGKQAAFILGLIAFLSAQFYLSLKPVTSRQIPVEADDAYGHILHAEEIRGGCFFQDCAALNDLRLQFTAPTEDEDTAYLRFREYHRVFVVFAPLHSFALMTLRNIGLSYEAAYSGLALAAKLGVSLAIVYFLLTIFGKEATALALFLLTPMVFIGTGLHTIIPSSMALGMALLLWALVLQGHRWLKWLFLPLIGALLLTHSIGIIYSSVGLFLYALLHPRPWRKGDFAILISGAAMVGAYFLLPMFVQHPELSFSPIDFFPGNWDYQSNLAAGAARSLEIINVWLNAFNQPWVAIALVIVGALSLTPQRRARWILMALTLAALLVIAVFYVVPWFQAISFERTWVPTVIFLTGTIATGIATFARSLLAYCRKVFTRVVDHPANAGSRLASPLGLAITGLLLVIGMTTFFPFYARHYSLTLQSTTTRTDFALNPEQPGIASVAISTQTAKTIIYMSEVSLYYYLSNGFLDNGAIYYPAIAGSPEEPQWLSQNSADLAFLVANNPLSRLSTYSQDQIRLQNIMQIKSLDQGSIQNIYILIENQGERANLEVTWEVGNEDIFEVIEIGAESREWIKLSTDMSATSVSLRAVGDSTLWLAGVRFDPQESALWPWELGIQIAVLHSNGEMETAELSESALLQDLDLTIEVIDDHGVTVLADILQ